MHCKKHKTFPIFQNKKGIILKKQYAVWRWDLKGHQSSPSGSPDYRAEVPIHCVYFAVSRPAYQVNYIQRKAENEEKEIRLFSD